MTQHDFLYVENKSTKKKILIDKFWGQNGKKWVWSIWLQDSKFEYISGGNSWNKLVFCLMLQIAKLSVASMVFA